MGLLRNGPFAQLCVIVKQVVLYFAETLDPPVDYYVFQEESHGMFLSAEGGGRHVGDDHGF